MDSLSSVFAELFNSWVGILASFTIFMVIIIATCMFLWIRKQVIQDSQRKQ